MTGALQEGLFHMIAALIADKWGLRAVVLRKDPLPAPIEAAVRVLLGKGKVEEEDIDLPFRQRGGRPGRVSREESFRSRMRSGERPGARRSVSPWDCAGGEEGASKISKKGRNQARRFAGIDRRGARIGE